LPPSPEAYRILLKAGVSGRRGVDYVPYSDTIKENKGGAMLIGGFKMLIEGINDLSPLSKGWTYWIGFVNIASVFFLARPEARFVLAAFLLVVIFMSLLTGFNGYNRLLGLPRLMFWVPLLVILFFRLEFVTLLTLYDIWFVLLMLTNFACLIFSIIDVVAYIQGERS
jgi:hypothetical protein